MKLDIIDGEHQRLIFPARRLVFPVAPKRIILPKNRDSEKSQKKEEKDVEVSSLLILLLNVPRTWA